MCLPIVMGVLRETVAFRENEASTSDILLRFSTASHSCTAANATNQNSTENSLITNPNQKIGNWVISNKLCTFSISSFFHLLVYILFSLSCIYCDKSEIKKKQKKSQISYDTVLHLTSQNFYFQ